MMAAAIARAMMSQDAVTERGRQHEQPTEHRSGGTVMDITSRAPLQTMAGGIQWGPTVMELTGTALMADGSCWLFDGRMTGGRA
jgi:hypothetical protein